MIILIYTVVLVPLPRRIEIQQIKQSGRPRALPLCLVPKETVVPMTAVTF